MKREWDTKRKSKIISKGCFLQPMSYSLRSNSTANTTSHNVFTSNSNNHEYKIILNEEAMKSRDISNQ